MSTDILSAMSVTLGMPGISGGSTAGTAVSGDGMTFGDVLGQAVNTADEVVPAQDKVLSEDETPADDKVTFAELTRTFSEKVSNADEGVIKAAIQMIMSAGRAVEKLFGVGNGMGLDENDEVSGSVVQIFSVLIDKLPEGRNIIGDEILDGIADAGSFIPEELEINFSDENGEAEVLMEELADVIDEGLSESKDASEILKALKEALSRSDDDGRKTSMADAAVMVLCALSGADVSAENFDIASAEAQITPAELGKLSDMAKAVSSDMTPLQKNQAVIRIAAEAVIEKDPVKFMEFVQKPDKVNFVNMAKSLGGMHGLRINNASAQADEITESKNPAALPDIPAISAGNVFTDSEETAIFRELSEFVNIQLTERISQEVTVSEALDSVRELTVVLKPEHLGEVAVRITSDAEGKISVILSAANAEVGRAISENAAALSESLTRQNIEVRDVNVVNPSEAGAYMGLDFTNQGFNRGDYSENAGGESYSGGRRNAVEGISSDIEAADAARAAKLLKEAKLWTTA